MQPNSIGKNTEIQQASIFYRYRTGKEAYQLNVMTTIHSERGQPTRHYLG